MKMFFERIWQSRNAWKLPLIMIFCGNGRGMAMPYMDNGILWANGDLYRYSAGFGAQFHSCCDRET